MDRVHVLTDTSSYSSIAFNFPLQLHRRLLRDAGLDVKLFSDTNDERMFDCDALFVNCNAFGPRWHGLRHDVLRVLDRARERSGRIVWFDTTASSGTTQFEVLPHVDSYAKAQVLVDRAAYLESYHGHRIFSDFYFRRSGVAEHGDGDVLRVIPRPEDLERIHVSWNTSLGDFGVRSHRYRRIAHYVPLFQHYSARFLAPDRPRPIAVACRLGLGHSRATVVHHRKTIKDILERHLQVATSPVPRDQYLHELANAKVGVSPFGYGEVCFRDFEIILAGAALVKPDMSHLETWPPIYQDRVTYVAHRWDCADMKEVIEELVRGDAWKEISVQGQRVYEHYLLEREGRHEFCARVRNLARAEPEIVPALPNLSERRSPKSPSQQMQS